MIAALATLAFLVAGWAAIVAMLAALDDSGGKIVAALRGDSLLARAPATPQVTVRFSARWVPRSPPLRAKAEWRAAA